MSEVIVHLRGQAVVFQPLTIRQCRELKAELEAGKGMSPFADEGTVTAFLTVARAALKPDQGEVSEQLEDLIDSGDFGSIWAAVLGLPVVRRQLGEAMAGQGA